VVASRRLYADPRRAVRFIHFALFGGTLLSLHYYVVDSAICLAFGFLGFRPRAPRKWSANIAGSISRTARLRWRRKAQ
jgi:hypothetical protein